MASVNLIIQTAFVGDLFLAIPLMRRLKALDQRPVALVCRKPFGDFFKRTGLVDHIFEIDKKQNGNHQLREIRQSLTNLGGVHWVVSPHESMTTARFVQSLKAEKKIGFRHWWNFFAFDVRIKRPVSLPDAIRQLSLLRNEDQSLHEQIEQFAKVWHVQKSTETFERSVADLPKWSSMTLGDEFFRAAPAQALPQFAKPIVAMAPGSVWPTKRWSEENFVEVGQRLSARYQVVIIGAASERELGERVAQGISGAVNLCGQTSLYEMCLLLRQAKLLIANDSGAMHVGSTAGVPTIALFGPTTTALGYQPWQARGFIAQRPLGCRPCSSHGGRTCPIGTHECMTELKISEQQLNEVLTS